MLRGWHRAWRTLGRQTSTPSPLLSHQGLISTLLSPFTANTAGMPKCLLHTARYAILDFLDSVGSKPQPYSKEAGPEGRLGQGHRANVSRQQGWPGVRLAKLMPLLARSLGSSLSLTLFPLLALQPPGRLVCKPSPPAPGTPVPTLQACLCLPLLPPALTPPPTPQPHPIQRPKCQYTGS